MTLILLILALFLLDGGCHGDDLASHLMLLDHLPDGVSPGDNAPIIIRSNYSGSVRFQVAEDFRVVINVTAASFPAAYSVKAELSQQNNAVLLQVYQKSTETGFSLLWLFVGITAATVLVFICASIYALCWFNSENSMYDLAERKSCAGSSQPGMYRSRNSMQMALQQGGGDMALLAEEVDNIHNDDTLKRVPEMPEQEEAEAIEMEELRNKEKNDESYDRNDDASANVNDKKSRYYTQSKSIHKELLKKGKRKRFRRRKGAGEVYDTVMEYPEYSSEGSGHSDAEVEDKEKEDEGKHRHDVKEHHVFRTQVREMTTFHPKLARMFDPQKVMAGTTAIPPPLTSGQDASVEGSSPAQLESTDQTDPTLDPNYVPFVVQADIHQLGPASEILRNPPDKKNPLVKAPQRKVAFSDDKRNEDKDDTKTSNDAANLFQDIPRRYDLGQHLDVINESSQPEDEGIDDADENRYSIYGSSEIFDTTDVADRVYFDINESDMEIAPIEDGSRQHGQPTENNSGSAQNPRHNSGSGPSSRYNHASGPSSQSSYNPGSGPSSQSSYNPGSSPSSQSSYNPGSGPSSQSSYNPGSGPSSQSRHNPGSGLNSQPRHNPGHNPSSRGLSTEESVNTNGTANPGLNQNGSLKSHNGRSNNVKGNPPIAPKPHLKSAFTTFGVTNSPPKSSHLAEGGPTESSPPLPPPPDVNHVPTAVGDESFDFPPPPPKLLKIPEQGLWKEQPSNVSNNYNYVDFQKTPVSEDPKEDIKHSVLKGRGTTYQGPKYFHLTLLSITCVLGVIGGVYSQAYDIPTTVHVTVYAPESLLRQRPIIYFNQLMDNDVFYESPIKVERFDVVEPILHSFASHLCVNHTCDQGCDESNGQCICRKGYTLSDIGKCRDINECMEGGAKCDLSAGCLNSPGLYECICPGGFYGDGKTCKECRVPCNPGTYEVQPCTNSTHKICRDCTKICPDGFFMLRPCKTDSNSHCRACHKHCGTTEYEYQQCQKNTNRVCKDFVSLPKPEASSNMILENLYGVDDQTVREDYLPSMQGDTVAFNLDRGSDLKVTVTMKSVQAAQLFIPVESPPDGSFPSIPQSGTRNQISNQFCPSPVPDHYILHYDKLGNVTYSLGSKQVPEACQSFEPVGYFPGYSSSNHAHFMYSQPGPMTDLFDEIQPKFFQTSTIWVEKSKRCRHYSQRCENCTRDCARRMVQSNTPCSVLGSESDNGYSPRLQICYTCCARNNCSSECKDYHKRHCQPKKCLESNWIQFHVRPQWDSSRADHFYCHVRPLPRQHILDLEFNLLYQGHSFYKGLASLKGDKQWETEGKMMFKDKIVHVEVDAKIGTPPDFLEGEVSGRHGLFKMGKYRNQGPSVLSSVISGESVSIRPMKPFGQIDPAAGKDYDRSVLENSVLATEAEGPFKADNNLMAVTYLNNTYPYHVTHKNAAPQLIVHLPRDVSVLKSVFAPVLLIHKSIKGQLVHNGTYWVVKFSGRVKSCPGLLKVELFDPSYPTQPIFSYWMALKCPRKFHVHFDLPTSDKDNVEKELVVMVMDEVKTHQIRIHSPGLYGEDKLESSDQNRQPSTVIPVSNIGDESDVDRSYGLVFSTPYLASVFGAVVLLLCLAVFGLALAPDAVSPDMPNLRRHHTCMMIGHITINFFYSLLVSMTVFTIIVLAVNKGSTDFVSQYKQQSAAKTAVHHLELAAMRRHLDEEITRQNNFASRTKERCENSMLPVISDMNKLRQELLKETEDAFERQNIVTLLSEHSHEVLTQLAQNMFTFRNNFQWYVRNLLTQLSHDIETSLRSVEDNKWLAGARFLHGAVINIRRHLNNVSSKQFLNWAHLRLGLADMAKDMTIPPSLPDIPSIDGIPTPTAAPGTRTIRNSPRTDPTNRKAKIHSHWIYPFQRDDSATPVRSTRDKSESEGSRNDKDVLSVFYVFLGLMLCVDVLLFLHRFSKAVVMGRLLLYGYPEYVDCREKPGTDEDLVDDVFADEKDQAAHAVHGRSKRMSALLSIKKFVIQVVSTLFIPKAVVTIVLGVLVYATLQLADVILTPTMLQSLGLEYNMDTYLGLQGEMMNARILSHAEQINSVEYPAYQSWMVAYIERHQRVLEVHKQELAAMRSVHNQTYCQYLTYLGMTVNCTLPESDTSKGYVISTPGCHFAPVWPNFYVRKNMSHQTVADRQLKALLEGMRRIVVNTCQVVTVFMSIVVIKELFGAVLWIFIRRSGFVRLRIIFETTEEQTIRDG